MRRREFIKVVAGLAVALPFAVRAQQPERMRRIGVLLGANADDVEFQTWVGSFLQGLQQRAGALAKTLRLIPIGPRAMPLEFASTQQSWLHSRRTSSWHMEHRP